MQPIALSKLRNQMKFFLKTILALADHMGSKKRLTPRRLNVKQMITDIGYWAEF
jgi:hypothetical protein